MPQQQQQELAASLAFLAQRGEETSGHVELSNVLTCPSPHLLPLEAPDTLLNVQREGNQEHMQQKKKVNPFQIRNLGCLQNEMTEVQKSVKLTN